jgi:hypothetical protein
LLLGLGAVQLLVMPSLVLYICTYCIFVSRSSYGVDVKTRCPKAATPKYLADLRVTIEEFPSRDALDGAGDFRRREHGNGLEKEMDVIFVRTDFHENNFVVLAYGPTDVFQGLLDRLRKNLLSIFHRANQMIKDEGDVMGLSEMLAHTGMLLRV